MGFLDAFRVPYAVEPSHAGTLVEVSAFGVPDGPRLVWPAEPAGERPRLRRLGTMPVVGAVTPLDVQQLGSGWTPLATVVDLSGTEVAAVCRGPDGSVYLPFDPDATAAACLSERYRAGEGSGASRSALRAVRSAYYRLRPLVPRRLQLAARRVYSRRQAARRFPGWPVETGLHDLYDLLFALLAGISGRPIPALAPWPDGRAWALVLTHDVETARGYGLIGLLRGVEEELGLRSSWNLVPRRYEVEDSVVAELDRAGFEVGVHGLYHDGRDFESRETFNSRLGEMQAWGRRWGAVGFRSPATHRVWDWMPALGFAYDSSYSDTAPFEPEPGGSCTWLPFENGPLVELPITLPQDHTVFEILRADPSLWRAKAAFVRSRGGMVLALTHPDYMEDANRLAAYRHLLAPYARDETCWHALPRDVAAWWSDRRASRLVPGEGGWAVEGPAAGRARVVQLGGTGTPLWEPVREEAA